MILDINVFGASMMAACESKSSGIVLVSSWKTSSMNQWSQMASLLVCLVAIYSDSAVESVMICCFLEDQETTPHQSEMCIL